MIFVVIYYNMSFTKVYLNMHSTLKFFFVVVVFVFVRAQSIVNYSQTD